MGSHHHLQTFRNIELPAHQRDWFKRLKNKIWKVNQGEFRPNLSPGVVVPTAVRRAKRPLSIQELQRLLHLVKKYRLPLEVAPDQFGFFCEFRVYNHPSFPGTGPELLITLDGRDHIPYQGIPHCPNPKENSEAFKNRVFRMMAKYFRHPENLQALKLYGLELPQAREHYTY